MQKEPEAEKLILAKIVTGDQHAFEVLYKFYKNKVYGYALAILQEESAAEEVVQDIFIKLWLKRENLERISNFGGFLRITVRNETLNALKKISLEKKYYNFVNINGSELDFSTEQSIQFRETEQLLNLAIEKLPPQQKLVYNLCKIEGMDQKTVAKTLKISPLTVKVHLREALKSIRLYLSSYNELKIILLLILFLK